MFINVAEAQSHIKEAKSLVQKINEAILYPLIILLSAVALLVFIWGAFEFLYNAENEQARITGRTHMIYGVIGLLVMMSAYAILTVATATFGVTIP